MKIQLYSIGDLNPDHFRKEDYVEVHDYVNGSFVHVSKSVLI